MRLNKGSSHKFGSSAGTKTDLLVTEDGISANNTSRQKNCKNAVGQVASTSFFAERNFSTI